MSADIGYIFMLFFPRPSLLLSCSIPFLMSRKHSRDSDHEWYHEEQDEEENNIGYQRTSLSFLVNHDWCLLFMALLVSSFSLSSSSSWFLCLAKNKYESSRISSPKILLKEQKESSLSRGYFIQKLLQLNEFGFIHRRLKSTRNKFKAVHHEKKTFLKKDIFSVGSPFIFISTSSSTAWRRCTFFA